MQYYILPTSTMGPPTAIHLPDNLVVTNERFTGEVFKALSSPCVTEESHGGESDTTLSTKFSSGHYLKRDQDSDDGNDMCSDHPVPICVQIQKALVPPPRSMDHGVSFHQVEIRRYPMIVGDNPSSELGLPVCLDWKYDALPPLDLDDYEETRSKQRRKNLRHLVLSYYRRQQILERVHPPEVLHQAAKEVSKSRWQRQITRFFLPVAKLEEATQSARRKVKRMLGKQDPK